MTLDAINDFTTKAVAKRQYMDGRVLSLQAEKLNIHTEVVAMQEALVYVQNKAKDTQEAIRFSIEDIVNQFLDSIFPDEYQFELQFVVRRNKSECDLVLKENGYVLDDPLNNVGGGVADVLSIALRIVLLLISGKSKILILDEPGKNISANKKVLFFSTLSEICHRFEIQLIMVTHDPIAMDYSDNIIKVVKKNGVSSVSQEGK